MVENHDPNAIIWVELSIVSPHTERILAINHKIDYIVYRNIHGQHFNTIECCLNSCWHPHIRLCCSNQWRIPGVLWWTMFPLSLQLPFITLASLSLTWAATWLVSCLAEFKCHTAATYSVLALLVWMGRKEVCCALVLFHLGQMRHCTMQEDCPFFHITWIWKYSAHLASRPCPCPSSP